MASHPKSAVAEKPSADRARLRAQGLRPVQVGVPDTRSPEFRAEADRQARLVAPAPDEADVMAFIEAACDCRDME